VQFGTVINHVLLLENLVLWLADFFVDMYANKKEACFLVYSYEGRWLILKYDELGGMVPSLTFIESES
jgi:hypothetical protein